MAKNNCGQEHLGSSNSSKQFGGNKKESVYINCSQNDGQEMQLGEILEV